MDKFLPYMTNDCSVGLFCEEANDIYHSAHGALTEAYEKFIKPLDIDNILKNKKKLRVLDICYGIGYNSKVFINEVLRYSKNSFCIDCVDTNSFLMKLSPFISSNINFISRILNKKILYKNIDSYGEAKKIVRKNKFITNTKYSLSKDVKFVLYKNLYLNNFNYQDEALKKILSKNENHVFFDKGMIKIHQFLSKKDDKSYLNNILSAYLHNIYYQHVSNRYYNNKYNHIKMNFYSQDVRDFIKTSTTKYDIVLLDGFTPKKCPCIWSEDFFIELLNSLATDSLLVTYNTSAVVRSAMLNAGFFIGNIFDDKNNTIGTIASNNKKFIKNELSKKQLGLLGTKAGIPYRDNSLDLDNDVILANRVSEIENSCLESSSKYLKRYNNEI